MVPEAGIEPTTFGLEGHCSSAELLGHISLSLSRYILVSRFVFFLIYSICSLVYALFLLSFYVSSILDSYALDFLFLCIFLHQKNLNIKILAATYSRTSMRCTTIGTSWLNFCVRNGNRCTSTVLTTKILTLRSFLLFFRVYSFTFHISSIIWTIKVS